MDSQKLKLKERLRVEPISTKLIKPSSPTPEHLQNYKLSFFDQIISRPQHLPIVFFYPHNNTDDGKIDEHLEQSLSRTLTHVYPLAGRVTKDKCAIVCLDQGVTYIKAKVNCALDVFLKQASKDLALATLFSPQCIEDVNDANFHVTPLVIVQVTKFECGGIALCFGLSHIAMDGYTVTSFIYEWVKGCKLGIPAEDINFLSFYSGSTIFPTRDLSVFKSRSVYLLEEDNIASKRFLFDQVTISGLRDKLASFTDSGALSFRPTRAEIITALLWMALIRASEAINGHLKPSLLHVPMNFRGKISLPLERNSFGNYIIGVPVKFVPGKTKRELHEFVALIREEMQKAAACFATASSPDDIVSATAVLYDESFLSQEWGANLQVDKLMSTNMCNFSIHEVDFGMGKPRLIHFGFKKQACCLYRTDCGTGIYAQVNLKETYMRSFQPDHTIKALAKL